VLIFAPIGALLYTIWARVGLEVIIVLFKIGENTGELVRQGASGQPGGGQPALASPGGGMAPPPGVQPEGPGGDFAAPVGRAHPRPPQTEQHAPTQQRPPGVAGTPAGWYPDPQAEKRLRYWDGSRWTEHTSD